MTILFLLIPASLILGCLGLVAFLWSLRDAQYDDLDGARHRILSGEFDQAPKAPPTTRP